MTRSRLQSLPFYAGLTAIIWLIGLVWVPFRPGFREPSWIASVVGYLVSGSLSAVSIAAIASREERESRDFMDNFSARLISGLHTGVSIAGVFGLARLIFSLLPHPADRILGTLLEMATIPLIFAVLIAGAARTPPADAIVTSVRFFFTKEGIMTVVRPAVVYLPTFPIIIMWIGRSNTERVRDLWVVVVMSMLGGIVYIWLARSIWTVFGRPATNIRETAELTRR